MSGLRLNQLSEEQSEANEVDIVALPADGKTALVAEVKRHGRNYAHNEFMRKVECLKNSVLAKFDVDFRLLTLDDSNRRPKKNLTKIIPLHCHSQKKVYLCIAIGKRTMPQPTATDWFGTVAQLDNASGYGPEDWGFESLRYHHQSLGVLSFKALFFSTNSQFLSPNQATQRKNNYIRGALRCISVMGD